MNLIYQNWTGPIRSGVLASKANMHRYADTVGAEYRFDKDPNIGSRLCDVPYYYELFNPMLDASFAAYDKVLVVDVDVFAVDGLTRSIFDETVADIGLCTEPHQPALRATLTSNICMASDEKWARAMKYEMPRIDGRLKVFNTGVVMFTRAGLEKMRERFWPFQKYVDIVRRAGLPGFYCIDQNYLHAMMVMHLDYTEMDNGWNSYVHFVGNDTPRKVNDMRNAETKFVHIQLRGADDFDAEKLRRITNCPQSQWGL